MIGLFGGTFDPIHIGHVDTVSLVKRKLALDYVLFVPANIPPHRSSPIVSPEHRLAMVNLAIKDIPGFKCDDREIKRGGVSYMILTLRELRQELGNRSLCVILGLDSFLELPSWHQWTEILEKAHIVVMQRPGWAAPSILPDWWKEANQSSIDELRMQPHGFVYYLPVPNCEVSSTNIRRRVPRSLEKDHGLSPRVLQYIRLHRLYD
ncbi:MAG: nicotinic acid mononucleotide adenylyltransferase [Acidiferrobacteraceae bacterium]|nr:nicotinic acid mononucleotide adenylyltransferase [Acidiferrobacteraceae bacterium]|tara:strand:+ start:909 stop:1529 length:621 start_codon:yes stop_codon:yes gene_type:complete